MNVTIKRGYVDSRYGQLHYYATATGDGAHLHTQPPLFCLHATAYSGQTFLPLMRLLGRDRQVIALDTPGYGGSDAPPTEIKFAEYAGVLAEAMLGWSAFNNRDETQHTFDIFGFHTGALLATEIAAQYPTQVRALVLMGIPFFPETDMVEKQAWREKLVHETRLNESFDQFRARWDYFITHRTSGLSLARAFDCFVDELQSYPRDWWAHNALFDYLPEARLSSVQSAVCVIHLNNALAPASRRAALLMPQAQNVELEGVSAAPFDLAADKLAEKMQHFLNGL